MATEKPTKAEFLEALRENGINSLEDLLDAVIPETGGYAQRQGVEGLGEFPNGAVIHIKDKGTFSFDPFGPDIG